MMHSCWIEIETAALRHNFRAISDYVGTKVRLLCVVKANAYGCGAVNCAQIFAEAGADYFAVTRLSEALPLRKNGILAPILLLSPALPDELETLVQLGLTACLSEFEDAQKLSQASQKLRKTAKFHLKLDVGMNRFGVAPASAAQIAEQIRALPNLELEGVFTHFPNALEANSATTKQQYVQFFEATNAIGAPLSHCANSAALVRFPEMRLNAVRPGTILYGQFPAASVQTPDLKLQDPFRAKARVVALREVQAGQSFGYGSEWNAPRASKIAILACGYADGLMVEPHARIENWKTILERAARGLKNPNAGRITTIRGQKAPIVGRVAMQTCALDVTAISDVQIGDEVIVPMRRVTSSDNLPRVFV